jgi:hypothetical protein
MFENRAVRKIFVHKRGKVTGGGENCITRSFIICPLQILLGGHVASAGEVSVPNWVGKLKRRDQLHDLGLDWRIILKCIVKK